MGLVPMYFEAAAVIVTLVLLGQVLEFARPRKDECGDSETPRSRRQPPHAGSGLTGATRMSR